MTDQKLSLRESLRGFPLWQMSVICLIRFSEPIAFTSLFPYVYFMIRDFGVVKDPNKISAYTGYLLASFAFFQFLMCIQWSRLSDKVGRKPILLCGLTGTAISMLIFGFAPNFYVALFARSLLGALNGNIAVLRTVIGEVATERRHQAVAFSTLPLLWNLGSVVGPLLGGSKYLTRPRSRSSNPKPLDSNLSSNSFYQSYDDFMNKYPYALSNVVVAIFLFISLIAGILFLEETHPRFKKRKDYGLELGDTIRKKFGFIVPIRPWNATKRTRRNNGRSGNKNNKNSDDIQEETPLLANVAEQAVATSTPIQPNLPLIYDSIDTEINTPTSPGGSDSEEFQPPQAYDIETQQPPPNEELNELEIPVAGRLSRRLSLAFTRRFSSAPSVRPTISRASTGVYSFLTDTEVDFKTSKSGFNTETFTSPVINTMIANFALSFQQLVFLEFLPVLLAGTFQKDKLKFPITITGGFGYDSDSIGRLLSSTGFLGVLVITILFPWIDRNVRPVVGYRIFSSIFPFVYFILPFIIFTLHDYNPFFPEWFSTVLIYVLASVATLASATAFPQIVILIHRATLPQHRALVNGSALSMNSLARCIAPLSWGWLISFFDSLNLGGLSWWLLSLFAALSLIQAFRMGDYNEDLKTTEEEE